jgi:crossover junction endodeoxyribonuclease RuvC
MDRKEVQEMRIIGIDPGISGAIAMYDGTNIVVEDVPTIALKKTKGKGEKNVINITALADLFNFLFAGADHAYVERVGAMPGQGVTSMFNFGDAFGTLKMGVAMVQVPFTLISPTEWKAKMGLNNDGEKSRMRALHLFPRASQLFQRKMDHNRAEAALLAWYGYNILTIGKVPHP